MKSWAITGSSRGIGLEFVHQLSRDKNKVVFAIVRNVNGSMELTELAAENPSVHIVQGDVTVLPQLEEAAKTIASVTGGSLDVLINNAAYLSIETAAILPSQLTDAENLTTVEDSVQKSIQANVLGAIYATNSFLPLIEKGTEKKIIHITSGMADTDLILNTGIAASVPYSASKAMLNAVVAKYGAELQPRNIHVVAMSPGWVDTNAVPKEAEDWMASMFRKIDPSVEGRISKGASVQDQLETISKLGWETQGRMISHHGDRNWF